MCSVVTYHWELCAQLSASQCHTVLELFTQIRAKGPSPDCHVTQKGRQRANLGAGSHFPPNYCDSPEVQTEHVVMFTEAGPPVGHTDNKHARTHTRTYAYGKGTVLQVLGSPSPAHLEAGYLGRHRGIGSSALLGKSLAL